jgi:8-oxo-dGTP diphosphatase
LAGIPVGATGVAIIIENQYGELLLQLRENRPGLPFANHWTLPGGLVEPGETPLAAAYRELREEIGVEVALEAWLTYERVHESSDFIIEQHIFVGQTDRPITGFTLGEGVELRYVLQQDVNQLPIAYGFDELLQTYLATNR